MTAKLIALVVPLGLDTIGVALALGMAGLPSRRRLQLSVLFAGFEATMPPVGVGLGAPLGHATGGIADYLAAGLVAALGIYMLVASDKDRERDRLLSMTERGVIGALALGIGISLDELAIGFSAGLLRLPLVAMVIAIAAQAFIVMQIGVRLGSRVSANAPEAAETLAGVALLALGVALLVERLSVSLPLTLGDRRPGCPLLVMQEAERVGVTPCTPLAGSGAVAWAVIVNQTQR